MAWSLRSYWEAETLRAVPEFSQDAKVLNDPSWKRKSENPLCRAQNAEDCLKVLTLLKAASACFSAYDTGPQHQQPYDIERDNPTQNKLPTKYMSKTPKFKARKSVGSYTAFTTGLYLDMSACGVICKIGSTAEDDRTPLLSHSPPMGSVLLFHLSLHFRQYIVVR